jgi:hypothetical protein
LKENPLDEAFIDGQDIVDTCAMDIENLVNTADTVIDINGEGFNNPPVRIEITQTLINRERKALDGSGRLNAKIGFIELVKNIKILSDKLDGYGRIKKYKNKIKRTSQVGIGSGAVMGVAINNSIIEKIK